MKLYEIANEYVQILQLVEAGELTQDQIADTLESIGAEFDDKVRTCMMVVRQLQSDSNGIGAEIDRLKSLQKSIDSSAEGLIEYIKSGMLATGKDRLDLGLFKLTLRTPTKAVNIIDESKLPAKFFRVIPESKVVDKVALAAELKIGDIDGAELIDGKRSLLIK